MQAEVDGGELAYPQAAEVVLDARPQVSAIAWPGRDRHAHDGRTPAAAAWMLCAGAAVVLGATMLIAASLQIWDRDRAFYRPLARTCAVAALICLGVAALRPALSGSR